MLIQQHYQNILRMLQTKCSTFVNISHYRIIVENFFVNWGLNNIPKVLLTECFTFVII